MKLLLGVLIVAAHAFAFRALLTRVPATDFVVDVTGPLAAPSSTLSLDGSVTETIRSRVAVGTDGSGPGLHRKTWSIDYRGGFSRSAYAAQLVGPYQDPDALACSGRVVVSQRLLDDGKASPGTLADEIKKEVTAELSGLSVWPAGSFTKVEHIGVKWARLELHPDDWSMIGKAPNGYVQVSLRIGFERVSVPMVLALIPNDIAPHDGAPHDGKAPELSFHIVSRADFSFDNRVLQFLNDKLGGSKLATKLARKQIDGLLLSTLAPPPPFALDDKPDGQALQFTYCDQPPEVADNRWGALPFAVMIGRVHVPSPASSASNDLSLAAILPPRRGPAPHADIANNAELALDLDLDALNAILYELWRSGYLDAKLAEAGLDKTFNTDPTVTSLLSIRVSPPRLALPPTLSPGVDVGQAASDPRAEGVLRLAADARIAIADGAPGDPKRSTTVGRVWGTIDFAFFDPAVSSALTRKVHETTPNDAKTECTEKRGPHDLSLCATTVSLSDLDLACERGTSTTTHATVAPCYGDLVAAMRDRSSEFDGALTDAFSRLLTDIFVERRIGASGLPADLVVKFATPSVIGTGDNTSLHLDLHAALVPAAH